MLRYDFLENIVYFQDKYLIRHIELNFTRYYYQPQILILILLKSIHVHGRETFPLILTLQP